MTHRQLAIATQILASILCVASYGQMPVSETDAHQWGFTGPIHTVKEHDEVLNPDPRLRTQPPATAHTFWQLFNANGEELERGELDAQDNPIKLQRFEIDRARNMLVSIQEDNRHELDLGPFGPTEHRLYTGDKLLFRTVYSYDESGRMVEVKVWQLGVLLHTDKDQYGKRLSESWRFTPSGQISFHRLSRYDEDGDLVEQIDYDARDEPAVVFRLNKTELLYFWRNAACGCGSFVNVTRDGTSASYEIDQSGRFKKWISHYRVPWPGLSIDDETFDASRNLTDRMTYDYVDDAYGNWTTRVTNVRDPNTGNMVPIKKEVRTLTYFASR